MTAKQQRIQLLQAMPFFGAVSDNTVSLILDLSQTLVTEAGQYFFSEGDEGDSLYILERGQAVVFKLWGESEYVLRRAKTGDCFGELALIAMESRYASVRAELDCQAIKIPSSALHNLYQQDPEQFLIVQMNMGREVGRRLRLADERWFELQRTAKPSPLND